MLKLLLTTVIASSQLLIGIIPLKWKIRNNRRRFPNDFTVAGWFLVVSCVISIVGTVKLYMVSENEQSSAKIISEGKQKHRDNLYRTSVKNLSLEYEKKLDSSYQRSQATFIEITARYGLHYDSLNQKLVKRNDSMRVEILPDITLVDAIGIELDSVKGGRYYFTINPVCHDASASSINITCNLITYYSGSYVLTPNVVHLFAPNGNASKNSLTKNPIYVQMPQHQQLEIIFLNLKGSYKNKSGNKTIKVDELFAYDLNNKIFGKPYETFDKAVRKTITEKKGIK